MWTDTTRAQCARAQLTLPSDLTDAEWAVLEPILPQPWHVCRPGKWPMRKILEAILYPLRCGLPWCLLPPYFLPVSTVRRWFYLWRDNGLWLSFNHALLLIGREAAGGEALPSAGGIDSQSGHRQLAAVGREERRDAGIGRNHAAIATPVTSAQCVNAWVQAERTVAALAIGGREKTLAI